MGSFVFNTSRSIQFGAGALSRLGETARSVVGQRILLVTDPGLRWTGIVDRALGALSQAGIEVTLFSDVEADPPEAIILRAVAIAQDAEIQGVIGLGGGSSLDVAKLVALLAVGVETLQSVYGVGKAKGPRLPLILVPTTAGTGSEVTPISIVTTGASEKMGVVSPVLLPDVAILDPELTYGLPAHITAATGIDAMVHAIEAFASANPNNNPLSRMLAVQALQLMAPAILTAVHHGTDAKARGDMLLGSMLAGQAFANSPVAAVHALAYPLGGHFHIPHGLSNALVLPHVLRFNALTVPGPYIELAPHMFPSLGRLEGQERAAAFCEALEQLSRDCGLPQRLRDMDIGEDWLPRLAHDAMNQTRLLVNNPRTITEADALAIYRAAY
ncbi:iron-containing alcohol dehydrogenase [Rhizobium leguminosarum]|uniref:iron-containing alcohol dehydrogenase n=1 Tax=Rhizobium leguminosarum TaxID=384 RepID=UPI001C91D79A|nr:iron-containing alcohol dehydrogenase [Rhizobium leguminosarum]MBY2973093.1 iron-containing alcohol dehydrogenase [Rhizobium leguminosarum]MBY2980493.1 iron-containing alcohol dehydrogenase [Rhizobium leguminosarum]MBY3009044.1 iron-containing alcohol dehydrogenase [Rhizobium leguminosarum]